MTPISCQQNALNLTRIISIGKTQWRILSIGSECGCQIIASLWTTSSNQTSNQEITPATITNKSIHYQLYFAHQFLIESFDSCVEDIEFIERESRNDNMIWWSIRFTQMIFSWYLMISYRCSIIHGTVYQDPRISKWTGDEFATFSLSDEWGWLIVFYFFWFETVCAFIENRKVCHRLISENFYC